MSTVDRLLRKAHDYLAAATAFTIAAIIMREIAAALEDGLEDAA